MKQMYTTLAYLHRICKGWLSHTLSDCSVQCLQTSIHTEGFRSLKESEPVEYELDIGGDGRCKAVNVTGPNGIPPQVCNDHNPLFNYPLDTRTRHFNRQQKAAKVFPVTETDQQGLFCAISHSLPDICTSPALLCCTPPIFALHTVTAPPMFMQNSDTSYVMEPTTCIEPPI